MESCQAVTTEVPRLGTTRCGCQDRLKWRTRNDSMNRCRGTTCSRCPTPWPRAVRRNPWCSVIISGSRKAIRIAMRRSKPATFVAGLYWFLARRCVARPSRRGRRSVQRLVERPPARLRAVGPHRGPSTRRQPYGAAESAGHPRAKREAPVAQNAAGLNAVLDIELADSGKQSIHINAE